MSRADRLRYWAEDHPVYACGILGVTAPLWIAPMLIMMLGMCGYMVLMGND
jgi:hypothetical protein